MIKRPKAKEKKNYNLAIHLLELEIFLKPPIAKPVHNAKHDRNDENPSSIWQLLDKDWNLDCNWLGMLSHTATNIAVADDI